MRIKSFFVIIGCLLFFLNTQAQLNSKKIIRHHKRITRFRNTQQPFGESKKYSSLSLNLNSINYFGDLAPTTSPLSTDVKLTKPSIGFSFMRRLGPRYTLLGSFTYGALRGSDNISADQSDVNSGIYRFRRNLSFRNHIKELSVQAMFDYFENDGMYSNRATWTPYVLGGFAIFHHNPQARVPANDLYGTPFENAGEWVDLQRLGTEGQYARLESSDANYGIKPYHRVQPAALIGAGARFYASDRLDLSVEYCYRYLFTDYIDDVSGNYVDLGVFADRRLAQAMSYRTNEVMLPGYSYVSERNGSTYHVVPGYGFEHPQNFRGNKKNNDVYMTFTLRVSYILENKYFRAKSR